MAQCKAVDISQMPHNVLKDFLNGDLSFQDAYKKYPLSMESVKESDEEEADKDDNVVTLSVRK